MYKTPNKDVLRNQTAEKYPILTESSLQMKSHTFLSDLSHANEGNLWRCTQCMFSEYALSKRQTDKYQCNLSGTQGALHILQSVLTHPCRNEHEYEIDASLSEKIDKVKGFARSMSLANVIGRTITLKTVTDLLRSKYKSAKVK